VFGPVSFAEQTPIVRKEIDKAAMTAQSDEFFTLILLELSFDAFVKSNRLPHRMGSEKTSIYEA
jgi:hypothetical protein